jgi:hypothetical protein
MSTYAGSFTVSGIGNVTISGLPFTPNLVKLTASGRTSLSENDQARMSVGVATDTFKSAHAMLANGHGDFTREYLNDSHRCLVVLATPGGVLTKVVDIQHVSFGTNSWTFNCSAFNSDYRITAEFHA